MLVNTKQKVAVLAVGLAVATTGLVTDEASATDPPAITSATYGSAPPVGDSAQSASRGSIGPDASGRADPLTV